MKINNEFSNNFDSVSFSNDLENLANSVQVNDNNEVNINNDDIWFTDPDDMLDYIKNNLGGKNGKGIFTYGSIFRAGNAHDREVK